MRGNSSPARVASITATARSLVACASCASNGTRKCKRSQVSALTTVNSAGLVTIQIGLVDRDLAGIDRIKPDQAVALDRAPAFGLEAFVFP